MIKRILILFLMIYFSFNLIAAEKINIDKTEPNKAGDVFVKYRGEYYSPAMAAASSVIPLWSGSFNPYLTDLEFNKFSGFGAFFVLAKGTSFAAGSYFLLMKILKTSDADDHSFYGEYEAEGEDRKAAKNNKGKAITAFAIWAGITAIDMVYSAYYVHNYNQREEITENKPLSFSLMPKFDSAQTKIEGINLAAVYKW